MPELFKHSLRLATPAPTLVRTVSTDSIHVKDPLPLQGKLWFRENLEHSSVTAAFTERVRDEQSSLENKDQDGRIALIEKWADLIWLNPVARWIGRKWVNEEPMQAGALASLGRGL